jgi:hypothetical protein
MAAWQYDLHFIPREKLLEGRSSSIPEYLTDEESDETGHITSL